MFRTPITGLSLNGAGSLDAQYQHSNLAITALEYVNDYFIELNIHSKHVRVAKQPSFVELIIGKGSKLY